VPRTRDNDKRRPEARRLLRIRSELELSQRQLARQFGVAASAIAQWENGLHTIPGPVMRLIELYEFEMGLANGLEEIPRERELVSRFHARTPRAAAAAALWLLFFGTLQQGESNPLLRSVRLATLQRYSKLVGDLKGLAMKLGQMTSYADIVLSEPERRVLETLQTEIRPMSRAAVVQVLVHELAQTPRQLFAEWDPEPLATASIGQVHRARLQTGKPVAVKMQYPRIVEALETDLQHASVIDRVLSLFMRGQKSQVMFAEFRERILEECDYVLEAANQKEFSALFSDRVDIRIPEVVDELSGRRVLVTEFATGVSLDSFARTASPSERTRAGSTLLDFYLESAFRRGMYNTDPNPGNFLFATDHITFVDFGRVKRFSPNFIVQQRRLLRAMFARNRQGVRTLLVEIGAVPEPERYDFDSAYRGLLLFHRFALCDTPFAFTAEHLRKTWRMFVHSNPNMTRTNFTSDMVFLNQFYFGVTALLVRLDARLDYRGRMLDLLYDPDEERPPPFSAAELKALEL
jgi:predicted unusual protein kinase regulating ubiquinone biosynthesis (AarF/ABC1/UbiB family)/DNA-binding XRE family transcriptional regulator